MITDENKPYAARNRIDKNPVLHGNGNTQERAAFVNS